MKKIPPDIDQLMWTIAEAGDARAAEDFEQRFPDLKYELAKRLLLLRQLRGARKAGAGRSDIPHFEPRLHPAKGWARPAWSVAAVVAFAILAYASYSLTGRIMANPPQRPGSSPAGAAVRTPIDHVPANQPLADGRPPQPKEADLAPSPYQKKITIQIERAKLMDAIQQVAAQAQLQIEIGPGMENPDVTLAYNDMSGIAILEDMGKQLGFTPFYEGDGKVLVVPAVDPKKLTEPSTATGTTHVVEDPTGPKPTASPPPKAPAGASAAHR